VKNNNCNGCGAQHEGIGHPRRQAASATKGRKQEKHCRQANRDQTRYPAGISYAGAVMQHKPAQSWQQRGGQKCDAFYAQATAAALA
jgi:hypothetical protein